MLDPTMVTATANTREAIPHTCRVHNSMAIQPTSTSAIRCTARRTVNPLTVHTQLTRAMMLRDLMYLAPTSHGKKQHQPSINLAHTCSHTHSRLCCCRTRCCCCCCCTHSLVLLRRSHGCRDGGLLLMHSLRVLLPERPLFIVFIMLPHLDPRFEPTPRRRTAAPPAAEHTAGAAAVNWLS